MAELHVVPKKIPLQYVNLPQSSIIENSVIWFTLGRKFKLVNLLKNI